MWFICCQILSDYLLSLFGCVHPQCLYIDITNNSTYYHTSKNPNYSLEGLLYNILDWTKAKG